METITALIQKEHYKIEITSESGNTLISDEPIESGGKDLGFSPKELLIASLAACTNATLRMYADRKDWPLEEVKVHSELIENPENKTTSINRRIHLVGNLSDEQKNRLLHIANLCPVHKILSNPIEINTQIEI